ncbi:uncharacterized protein [Malus domestica]|uniref:uncharacterized protein n=1 Tax=Malus domestica TaxID=3750 RepID=UPI0039763371
MDVISKITQSSGAAKHVWILVATDYFTKWVEAKSYAELTSKEVCSFVEENIVTRFGVPETIITDNGTVFTSDRLKDYTSSLFSAEYNQAMRQELEDLEYAQLDAYNLLAAQKKIAERAYNQRVRKKTFGEGELVWQTVLPVGTKDPRFSKWSSNWEWPFIIHKVLGNRAYRLKDRTGIIHKLLINGKFLKKYYPVTWEMQE